MEKLFKLSLRGTDKKTEIIAGLTTFMTMAYVLAVQPAAICGGEAYITDVNGVVITKSAIMITCALVSGLITLLMAFYTNFPFALSTGMGSNFILGALIQSQALSFGAAMAITLISGIVFVLLTVFGLRDLIVRVIPKNIKIAISASIGFFIAYLGFKNCGIGSFENGIALGNLTDPAVLLAIGGLLLIIVLNALNVKGAILISIIATTLIGIPLGVTTLNGVAAVPDFGELGNVMFNLDFKGVFTASGLILVFVCFFGDFFSTLGTVLAVANRANMLDENGNLPGIERPFLVDAIGTCIGATITIVIAGTIAGLIPAIKAARIRPIEALRADRQHHHHDLCRVHLRRRSRRPHRPDRARHRHHVPADDLPCTAVRRHPVCRDRPGADLCRLPHAQGLHGDRLHGL